WPDDLPFTSIKSQLEELFLTHFTLHRWHIASGQGRIELEFDEVDVLAGTKEQAHRQIRLELIWEDLTDALTLARQMLNITGSQLGSLSKAARGYLLAGLSQLKAKPKPLYSEHFLEAQENSGLFQGIAVGLAHWQHHDTCFHEQPTAAAV